MNETVTIEADPKEELDELRAFVYYTLDDNSLDDIEFLASRLLDKWQNNWSRQDLPAFEVATIPTVIKFSEDEVKEL